MTAKFEVSYAGPSVSIQDAGRLGFMRYGVPHSGPMDRVAFTVLRATLDKTNDFSADFSAIEVSMGGLLIKCIEGAVTVGFIGGEFSLDLDGRKLSPWTVFTIEAGMTLAVRSGTAGSWGYLGFLGNMQTTNWLGSCSNHLNSGLCGHPFVNGDLVTVKNAKVKPELHTVLPIPDIAKFDGTVRAVLGPQDKFFSSQTITALEKEIYSVTPENNRMGMRLAGEKLTVEGELSMPSEALLRGAVQVPGHGDPIILLSGHQTTGGYPKIATVLTPDINRLVQSRPGDKLRFSLLPVAQADEKPRRKQRGIGMFELEKGKLFVFV